MTASLSEQIYSRGDSQHEQDKNRTVDPATPPLPYRISSSKEKYKFECDKISYRFFQLSRFTLGSGLFAS